MTHVFRLMRAVAMAALVLCLAVPAMADTVLSQPFEDATWDEDPQAPIEESIEALREVHPYLVDVRSLDLTRTELTNGFTDHGLKIVIPPGGYRGFGPYARLPKPVTEAWFRYNIRLLDFRPVSSGKLPGLADASVTVNAKGCNPSTNSDPGWSARLMFDTTGTGVAGPGEVPLGVYVYHLGQAGDCGDELMFSRPLTQQRWTCIEGRVRMNTPGESNGVVQAWMDGERVFSQGGFEFRRPSESGVAIREMWDNVYFGGAYPTPNTLSLVLDDMVVSDSGRVGCVDPFHDDNESMHEAALTELHARGLLFGCARRAVCPTGTLTRGEFAAMLQRVVGAPAGPNAFTDDSGHFAEGPINALARADILRGCNPPANTMVCPDASVTRAEVAALLTRALDLPSGPDAFGDDNGHWAESDIDALAAAGITKGCDEAGYCPARTMFRMEAATFVLRVDDMVEDLEPMGALPDWPPAGPPPPKPVDERE